MLDFMLLWLGLASTGLIPTVSSCTGIPAACRAELYDFEALGLAIASAGNSAIPLVKALGKQIASVSPEAERYVHLGATSQDVMDSGLVLQLRAALELIEQDLQQLAKSSRNRPSATPRLWRVALGCSKQRRDLWG